MSEIELKPCPFCGSDDVTCNRFEDVYYVECFSCSAKVESYNVLEDAVARWNARAIDRDALLKIADDLDNGWAEFFEEIIACEDVDKFEQSIAAQIRKAVG